MGGITEAQVRQNVANFSAPNATAPVITPQSLSPVQAVKLPGAPASTTATGILGVTGAVKDASLSSQQAKLDQDRATAQATQTSDRTELTKTMNEILGIQTGSEQARQEAGIDAKTEKVNEYTSRLEQLQRKEQNEIRALEGTTLTDSQRSAKISEIQRSSAFEQADVAVLQSAANRDLATAQTILDSRTKLALEPLKTKLQFQQFFYEENKDSLTKAEDRAFQNAIKESDRAYQREETFQKAKNSYISNAIEQGAPASVISAISSATNEEEAISAAGTYGGDLKRKMEIAKLNADIKASGIPAITNQDASKYSQALSVILGSGSFTKDQKASLVNAVNSGQDPFSVIKNQAKNIMGQTNATKLDNYETAKAQVEDISSLLSDFYAKGGDTGIFKGNLEKTVNRLGQVNDPELVEIATNIAGALQIYRNAVSGTAYSVQEGQDIASIFPGINKSQGLNEAIIKARLNAFDTTIDAQYRNTLGRAYDELKASVSEDSRQSDPLDLGVTVSAKSSNPLGI